MGGIIPVRAYKKLNWFFTTVGKPVFYYTEMLGDFHLVEGNEWVLGFTFVCNSCGMPASYIREDWCSITKNWLVTHIICTSCGTVWKVEGVRPVYDLIFLEWNLEEDIRWEINEI